MTAEDTAIAAVLAFVIDCVLGDPRASIHPVVLIGKLIFFFRELALR